MQALMLRSCSHHGLLSGISGPRAHAATTIVANGFLDDALDNVKSGLAKMSQTATVQHVLVPSRTAGAQTAGSAGPVSWYEAPRHRRDGSSITQGGGGGVSPAGHRRLAPARRAAPPRRRPTPRSRWRGRPGELTFKRGEMAKV